MERQLTQQERDILRLHGSGLSSAEIARRLGISETTVAWIVGNLVGEWGAARTTDLARALSISRREQLVAQFALPLGVMLLLTAATVAVLGVTGTLHGPLFAPDASRSASPTTLVSPGPTMTGRSTPSANPVVTQAPPAADGNTTPAATPAPLVPTPRLATLPPVIPTIAPLPTPVRSLPLPILPLPTVPPLPTPSLPVPPL